MSREGWLAPSFRVPDDARGKLHEYAKSLPWPEGSELNDPNKYHVTGMYAHEGYQDPANQEWVAHHAQEPTHMVRPRQVESFEGSPGPKGHPVVVTLDGDTLQEHGERLHDEAEARGLPVSRFEGGYKPHITLGYSPSPMQHPPPPVDLEVGPVFELHKHYDNLKQKQSNILDPIWPTLAPEVWDGAEQPEPIFKPQHKKWLLAKALTVFNDGGYEGIENYISFVITGSICTYQYSERSDIDTSLFIDFATFPEWSRAEMIGLMVEHLDGEKLPGTTYDLQLFIQPPEIKPEDIFKPGLRSGYLLDEDRWLVPPDRSRVHDIEHEMNDTYTYALENADKMDRLIKYEPHKAVLFWHQLHRRRARDQRSGKGDFSPSNVAYKMIVNRGLTKDLEKIMGQKIVL